MKSRKKEQFFDVIVDSLQSVTGHDFIEHPQLNVRQSFVVRITKEKCDKMCCWVYPSNNVGLLYLVYWGGRGLLDGEGIVVCAEVGYRKRYK